MRLEGIVKRAFAGALAAAALFAVHASAQPGLPLDEKARYEKALEQKADEVLLKLLGPGKAKAAVEAVFEAGPAAGTKPSAPVIKKLNVTVILNKTLSGTEVQSVQDVIPEALGMDTERGDYLSVIKTSFAPEGPGPARSATLAFFALAGLGAAAFGLVKLAARRGARPEARRDVQPAAESGAEGGKTEPAAAAKKDEKGAEPEADGDHFNVTLSQVDFLVDLLSGEDPANVALVAGRLRADVRSDFLAKFPADAAAEVVASMAQVRFVEPGVVAGIRRELEARLAGAFGGIGKVVEALEQVNPKARKEMLEKLERRHPGLAREVRPRVFLPEDLVKFSAQDLAVIAAAVPVEDWALALKSLPPQMKENLRKPLEGKTWTLLEQALRSGSPSADKSEKAVEHVAALAQKLMREGRVSNPLRQPRAVAARPAPLAAAAPAPLPVRAPKIEPVQAPPPPHVPAASAPAAAAPKPAPRPAPKPAPPADTGGW